MQNGLYQDIWGNKAWFKNNEYNRIIYQNGNRLYYKHAYLHKVNGPAVIYNSGYYEWHLCGNEITVQLNDYCQINNIDINDYQNLKFSDKLKLKFKFGLQL